MWNTKNILQIYSDESWVPDKRYQSIWLLSWIDADLLMLETELDYVLQSYNRTSLEYKGIDWDSNKTKCCIEMLKKWMMIVNNYGLKIDVLTRDTYDSRHQIQRRDDIQNFKRMYYKSLVKCCERWDLSNFEFFPDEHSAVDWDKELKQILKNTNQNKKYFSLWTLFWEKEDLIRYLSLEIEEKKSCENVLIQFIDIITWFVRLSFESWWEISNRIIKEMWQNSLFGNDVWLSRWKAAKFKIFKVFLGICKNVQSWVSFWTNDSLRTFNSQWNLNFWFYEPQHIKDKAPTLPTKASLF